ncbi:MAG: hypothetical protein QNJ54_09620 [Prochloraceae cyanobacterium]|nr:hypothetical protein [Prochloraceae cyanobacterium]
MIPFFVADRPMSLRILKGLPLQDYPGVKIGIMAHANTSKNFQRAFKEYPCEDLNRCDAIGGQPCPYKDDLDRTQCLDRQRILAQTIKMCDSGIFTKEGATLTYQELFDTYDRMNVEYGIMIDVLQNAKATIESAKEAQKIYKSNQYNFKLVVVAHGKEVLEYLECYQQLKDLGFHHIAIGGILRRQKNTVRYVNVSSDRFLFDILEKLRYKYPKDWLFALGCLNPRRIKSLNNLNVWADYKGWIFQYQKRNESLNKHLETLLSTNFEYLKDRNFSNHYLKLKKTINQREKYIKEQKKISKQLHEGKRFLRDYLKELYGKLQHDRLECANKIGKIIARGLLTNEEEKIVTQALKYLGEKESLEGIEIINKARDNRQISEQINNRENKINQINNSIIKQLSLLSANNIELCKNTKQLCEDISRIIQITEQTYRLEQVRRNIAEKILAQLS